MTVVKTLIKFRRDLQNICVKVTINGAIKVLKSNMQNGILPLNEKTFKQLRQKHPEAKEATEETLLPDKPEVIHPIKFEKIDAEIFLFLFSFIYFSFYLF